VIIKNYFKSSPVLKAWLFGSYGRGDADLQSDIVLLVELDYAPRIGLGFIPIKIDLEDLLNKKVDLVSVNGLSKYVKPSIKNGKQLIYEKQVR
jgi:predicted nucleotidyltransferase